MDSSFLKKQSTLAVIVSVSLILLAIITQRGSTKFMQEASKKISVPLNAADSIQTEIIESTLIKTDLKTTTLKRQYFICSELKNYFKKIGISYYVNHYAFSISSIVFITLLSLSVLLLANKGWQNSSLVLKSFLLTATVFASIYYFLPNVLNNQENFENHMDKVVEFGKIQSDILTLSNLIEQMDTAQIDSAITSNYKNISEHLDYIPTIDDSELRSKFTGLLDKIKEGS